MPKRRRDYTGYKNLRPDQFIFESLSINNPSKKEEELWMILEQFSEITENRNNLLKKMGITNQFQKSEIGKKFLSFCRQAKNYYSVAKTLPNSSSALLYYYSFLNLIKAYLILYYPTQVSGRVMHGLSCDAKRHNKFKEEKVRVKDGVFKLLYEHETGERITNNKSFSINILLSHCSDISYQYISAKLGLVQDARAFLHVFLDDNRGKAWGTIALFNFDHLEKCKSRIKSFLKKYKEVDFDKMETKTVFGFSPMEKRAYRFFEGSEFGLINNRFLPEDLILQELDNVTKGFLIPNHYVDSTGEFYLAHPYRRGDQFLINEFLSIYIVMYYLSSLVRYYPSYLDKIFDKKESWVINGFIESCPLTFLQYVVSKIVQKNFSFTGR